LTLTTQAVIPYFADLRTLHQGLPQIEKVDDLKLDWLRGKEKVGIIGANETPDWMITEAIERIKNMAA
jgi:4-hydroxy-3-methylbut-2-enyl diphosphate reductase IspH